MPSISLTVMTPFSASVFRMNSGTAGIMCSVSPRTIYTDDAGVSRISSSVPMLSPSYVTTDAPMISHRKYSPFLSGASARSI